MTSILKIKNVNKDFGKITVLNDININIESGDFLVLVGPSGCGKSTLLNCIAGLEKINSGDIFIDNKNMSDVAPKDRDIAMVFQSYALYPTMTVEKNITFGMKVRGIPEDIQKEKLKEVAKQLQIENLLKRKPGQLSGGQRQRVAMGRALVRNPKLFLFDEPLSNLDAKLRVEMRTEIKRLHYDLGASMVYVTHDQIEAMTLATKIVVMKDGFIQQIGTPFEIYNYPENIFVADFMGSPAMNLIEAKTKKEKNYIKIEIKLEDGSLASLKETKTLDLPEYIIILGRKGSPWGEVLKILKSALIFKASKLSIIFGNNEAKCPSSPIPSKVTSNGNLKISCLKIKFSLKGKNLAFFALFFKKYSDINF